MKKLLIYLMLLALLLPGCGPAAPAQVAATTLPVYTFTARLCSGTGITVTRLVTENVSCLHDYTLQVDQMRAIQGAQAVVISGAGLEEFLSDALTGASHVIDASQGLALAETEHHVHDHDHGHVHAQDPHIWLSPANAMVMCRNICDGLTGLYPAHRETFRENLAALLSQLEALQSYGEETLSALSCRELITFHDGFSYFAEAFDLHILHAVEEESGSEASAETLIELIGLVRKHSLPALFTEINGSVSAASIIAAETGTAVFTLDMCMAGDDYFTAMYRNIDTIREAMQ